jgi:hypothetical protein
MLASVRRIIRPDGIVLSRLRHRDERHVEVGFESLQFDVILEIARRTIDLVEQQSVQLTGVILGELDQRAEGLALVGLAGGLRDSIELDDRAVGCGGETAQRVFLHGE